MSYFLFQKNQDNQLGTVYKITENLSNLILNLNDYKIIEDNNVNFDNVKLNLLIPQKYNDNTIFYVENSVGFSNIENLKIYVNEFKSAIKQFTNNNPNHVELEQWNSYYNQLNNLNFNDFLFPITYSLEQYFKNNNKPYFSILQIP